MYFSTNPGIFETPKPCPLDNGTTVFYERDSLSCSCLAPFRADPDFAGPGIIASFLFIGWVTILVAAIPVFYSIYSSWKRAKGPRRLLIFAGELLEFETNHREEQQEQKTVPEKSDESSAANVKFQRKEAEGEAQQRSEEVPEPFVCVFCKRLLAVLCDAQIITGTAMVISTLAQWHHLTFYHEQLAIQYWWITLNSFWVSSIDHSRNTPEMNTWRVQARRLSIFTSVILSVVIQGLVAVREHSHWDPTISGQCYVSTAAGSNFAQNLFWLAGTGVYACILLISLFQPTRKWFDEKVNMSAQPSIRLMGGWALDSHQALRAYRASSNPGSFVRRMLGLTALAAKTACLYLAWVTWWLTVQFLSIWCAGNSSATIELATYSIFAGFLSWWIIFLKVQNAGLIRGNEARWTFGQSLPILLVVLILFHSIDEWSRVKLLRRGEKTSEKASSDVV